MIYYQKRSVVFAWSSCDPRRHVGVATREGHRVDVPIRGRRVARNTREGDRRAVRLKWFHLQVV